MKKAFSALLAIAFIFLAGIGVSLTEEYPKSSEKEVYREYLHALKSKGVPTTRDDTYRIFPYQNTVAFVYAPVQGAMFDFTYENSELLRYHVSTEGGTAAFAYQFDLFTQFMMLMQSDLSEDEAIELYFSLVHGMERQTQYPFYSFAEVECEDVTFYCSAIYSPEYDDFSISLYALDLR